MQFIQIVKNQCNFRNSDTNRQKEKGVQSILRMINYVAKFLQNLSEATSPLRELLRKDVHWQWEERDERSFQNIKQMLI